MKINTKIKLNNGVEMPAFGLGVFKAGKDTYSAVRAALDYGYRLIDTAMIYYNEEEVGRAIKDSGIAREEIFLTTKLWTDDIRADRVEHAYYDSLNKLNMDYADLYLIHWPVRGKSIDAYRAMEQLYSKGKVRAIGVSNFFEHHLNDLIENTEVVPAVNQVEIHPFLSNQDLIQYCKDKGIPAQSWSPLARGKYFDDITINEIARKYNKTPAQVIIRWHLEKGLSVIPKSVNPYRIKENAGVFDFELSDNDLIMLDSLNANMRTGSNPDDYLY